MYARVALQISFEMHQVHSRAILAPPAECWKPRFPQGFPQIYLALEPSPVHDSRAPFRVSRLPRERLWTIAWANSLTPHFQSVQKQPILPGPRRGVDWSL